MSFVFLGFNIESWVLSLWIRFWVSLIVAQIVRVASDFIHLLIIIITLLLHLLIVKLLASIALSFSLLQRLSWVIWVLKAIALVTWKEVFPLSRLILYYNLFLLCRWLLLGSSPLHYVVTTIIIFKLFSSMTLSVSEWLVIVYVLPECVWLYFQMREVCTLFSLLLVRFIFTLKAHNSIRALAAHKHLLA